MDSGDWSGIFVVTMNPAAPGGAPPRRISPVYFSSGSEYFPATAIETKTSLPAAREGPFRQGAIIILVSVSIRKKFQKICRPAVTKRALNRDAAVHPTEISRCFTWRTG
jgi:hypothetical protein